MHNREKGIRLDSLTGLRFLAMIPVFLFHSSLEGIFNDTQADWDFLNGVGTSGHVAVSYFFVLSGFVLTWSYRPADRARRFWRRRVFRVFPSHLVALVAVILLISHYADLPDWKGLGAQALLLQAWIPDPAYFDIGNSVTWSLSVDLAVYALFPLLYRLVERIRPGRLWAWAGVGVLVVALVPAVAQNFVHDDRPMPLFGVSIGQYWLVYFFPLARLVECLLGMLLARIVLTGRWIGWMRPYVAAPLVVVGYWIGQQLPYLYRTSAATVIPVGLLTASLAVADMAGRRTVLNHRFVVRLGELSFAFYLLHNPVLKYGHLALGAVEKDGDLVGPSYGMAAGIALIAAAFLLSLLLAWVLNVLVERPAMRRWSRPRPTPFPAPAPTPTPTGGAV
ncbi:acyltransferase family protein [Streptomyces sp. NRRL S-350]|uniref:acyltransferase family protein n=1 Tax=Streptomyces sp. NRRL S-350 TaxID=1463902 RepID=UPI0004BEF9BA|nr:acyltransferase [Streptomyces sp. NRRL S-350]